jgi:hypothetical protein
MSTASYQRAPHCCRTCFGPILQSTAGFVCAICDAASEAVEGICGCGIRVAGSKRAMFQCTANPERGPASPAAVVITFGQTSAVETHSETLEASCN